MMKMVKKIELGSKVKDIHSGFTGVAVARTEFINGCVQYSVIPKCRRNEMAEEIGIDSESLEVLQLPKKKTPKKKTKRNGGPKSMGIRMRGF